jgi:uncharacterized repeat protein (TIGR03803 family)
MLKNLGQRILFTGPQGPLVARLLQKKNMKIKPNSLKTHLTFLHNGNRTCAKIEPLVGGNTALTLPIRISAFRLQQLAFSTRLLWAIALVLTAFGAQAAVVLTTLYSFTGGSDGIGPDAALVQGSDGSFYGTTSQGGTNDAGTLFKISTNGAYTSLYSFGVGNDGDFPAAGLVQESDGDFYGTTSQGGTNGYGTVFKISSNGALTTLYAFGTVTDTNGNPLDGANPYDGLVQGSDSNLYGTTFGGGTNGSGTVFKISTNGVLTSLYSFGGGGDGDYPYAGLVEGSDGNFYGTTESGGTNVGGPQGGGGGTVFKISTNGALTILYSFGGAGANSALVLGSDGYFYGIVHYGYLNPGYGTVFKLSTNGALTTLYAFSGGGGALVQGSDGNFYGTTSSTVFQMTRAGGLTTLVSGIGSSAAMVQGGDGNFYGTTAYGGANDAGTVFRLTIVPESQAVTLTNNTLSLTWSTEAGGTYQLQYNSDLNSSNWNNLNSPVTATGATLSTTDSVTNCPQRFYRLLLVP